MIAKVIVTKNLEFRIQILEKNLQEAGLRTGHPDVLYIEAGEKLGIEQARRIKDHFLLKPYQAKGRAVIVEDLSGITVDAQNALLKVVEEPPEEAILLFGTPSTNHLLPTFLSRCQVIELGDDRKENLDFKEIEEILAKDIADRFKFVEKVDNKEEVLQQLLQYSEHKLIKETNHVKFSKAILEMERFQKAHVNIRGILEYLMLILPKI